MAYGDGLMVLGEDLTPVQVEAVASDIKTVRLPYPVLVEGFGLLVTETFAAHAVDPVFSLDFSNKDTARTEILTLTPSSALKRGDGDKAGVTALSADSDIVIGDVIMSKDKSLPKKLPAGSTLIIEHKTAAGEAGGAVVPVVLLRVDGYNLVADEILT